ncbi:hypothetical protein SAMN05518846_114115 [Brevibacillus centrosporus]|uniref:Uncharacterized protein n=1 Tax=Brevibacillus centrosporus TaxID=54910 RepID=A0A1I4A2T0_9BACL|nr:hypothetical protein SAMN05518846_114115 [Brevibacillus centrosporus]
MTFDHMWKLVNGALFCKIHEKIAARSLYAKLKYTKGNLTRICFIIELVTYQ